MKKRHGGRACRARGGRARRAGGRATCGAACGAGGGGGGRCESGITTEANTTAVAV